MESAAIKDLHTSTPNDVVHHSTEKVQHLSNNENTEPKSDANPEEIKNILEVIAATGNFWHDWDRLKNMLSFQLKQVLAEYPEAQISNSTELQRSTLSGETYLELVKRLDDALLSFIEGPPFTLQRICEILLNPKGTYVSLTKLALAFEKNVLVTSTLTLSTDPYPAKMPPEPNNKLLQRPLDDAPAPNGFGNANSDGDEEMVDAEAEEDQLNRDTEMKEERVQENIIENAEKNL